MPTFQYGNIELEYTLQYDASLNDVAIQLNWLDGLILKVPKKVEQTTIDQILYKKAPWILNKWAEINEIKKYISKREFVSGEKLPYLGQKYRLKVQQE